MTTPVFAVEAELHDAILCTHSGSGLQYIIGRIYNDNKKRFPNGTDVRTSPITEEYIGNIFQTRNTLYKVYFTDEKFDVI